LAQRLALNSREMKGTNHHPESHKSSHFPSSGMMVQPQWILELEPPAMEQRVREAFGTDRLELISELNLRDPHVLRLVEALQADLEAEEIQRI